MGRPGEIVDDPFIGMTISSKFTLQELIGSGGMGKVYRADQIGVGRTVAVKIMHRHLMGDETAAARFTNEARAASHLNHPNSIAVLDFGQTHQSFLYIVYEYLRGKSLDAVLRDDYPVGLGRVVGIMCQVTSAVESAHQLNIIHRDLKPENIFLEEASGLDFVKVLDFGIAKILDMKDRSITSPGMVPGTPEYMSPEQAKGEPLDPQSDVYSLGVILYELLTDTVPFSGASAVATMMSQVQDPPEPLSQRCPERDIPQELESITLRALSKSKPDRIKTAGQFGELLARWAMKTGVWRPPGTLDATELVIEEKEAFAADLAISIAEPRAPTAPPAPEPPLTGSLEAVLVGREQELRQVERFLGDPAAHTLRIQGIAGIGKSRIVREAIRIGEEQGLELLHLPPDPGWTPTVLGPAQRVALSCLGLAASTEPSTTPMAENVLQAAGRLGLGADDIPGIQGLFGITNYLSELDPDTRGRERSAAFQSLVQRAAEKQPMLVIFEELQRFDEPSRELVVSLATTSRDDSLKIIITHSPEDAQLWPPEVQPMVLEPLDPESGAELVRKVVRDGVTPEEVKRIAEAGRYQPLFMEQLAYARVLEGMADFPEKVADLVAARVERLPQGEREVLQCMAVSNDWLSPSAIARLLDREVNVEVLDRLMEKGLLEANDKGGYHFKHHLVAMVTYSSIPAEVRRRMHLKVAEHLRRKTSFHVAVLADHSYEGDDGLRAIEELDQAGSWAMQCLDSKTATSCYSRALEMVRLEWGKGRMQIDELEQLGMSLARRLARILRQTEQPQTARGILEEALSIAAGNEASRAELRYDLGCIDLEQGNLPRAVRHLELAKADAEASRADPLLGQILRQLARAVGLQGDKDRAGKLILESLETSRKASGSRGEPDWTTMLDLAVTASQVGFRDRARGYLLDALKEAESALSVPGKLRIIIQMAAVHQSCSEWNEAEMRLVQALELAAQVGDRTLESCVMIDLGRLRRIQGDVEEARKWLDRALERARGIGWQSGLKLVEEEIEMLRYATPQSL